MSPAIGTLAETTALQTPFLEGRMSIISPGMVEMSLASTGLVNALALALQMVEISLTGLALPAPQTFLADPDLISIPPEMLEASTKISNTLIRMLSRQRQ